MIEDAVVTEVSLTPRGANPRARILLAIGKSLDKHGGLAYVSGNESVVKKGSTSPRDTILQQILDASQVSER